MRFDSVTKGDILLYPLLCHCRYKSKSNRLDNWILGSGIIRNFLTDNREVFQYPRRANQAGSIFMDHPATVGIVLLSSVNTSGFPKGCGGDGGCRDWGIHVQGLSLAVSSSMPGWWNVLVPLCTGSSCPLCHIAQHSKLRFCPSTQIELLYTSNKIIQDPANPWFQRCFSSLSWMGVTNSGGSQQPVFLPAHHPYIFISPGCFPPRSHSSSSPGHSHLATLQERKYSKINLLISCLVCKGFWGQEANWLPKIQFIFPLYFYLWLWVAFKIHSSLWW